METQITDKPTGEPTKNLMDGLFDEMNRCREVLKLYEAIPEGGFGAFMIKHAIQKAEKSIRDNDVIAMIVAFQELKEIE